LGTFLAIFGSIRGPEADFLYCIDHWLANIRYEGRRVRCIVNKALILVLFSVIIGTVGQLCIKAAMLRLGPVAFGTPAEIISSSWQIMRQPLIWVALPLYGFGFIIWAAALSRLQLSFAYPLLSIGYLINPIAAAVFFDESVSPMRWAGILVIMVGIVLIGRS
jgi:drug/metabolite transporter (DMT)-like permease